MKSPVVVLLAAALLPSPVWIGCAHAPSAPPSKAPPRRRVEGPRAIPFAGGDPSEKGWVKADDLLWVRSEDVAEFRRGRLRSGDGYLTIDEADRVEKSPMEGYVLRTDHLVLRTNVPFRRARELARVGEKHIDLVLETFGAPLDLRLPADPLPVVVAATRAQFRRLLDQNISPAVDWGAFYQALDGTVYAADERVEEGGLSVVADLRHEMTHAILDLGRPGLARSSMFTRPHFWIWEGAAIWTEGLGDPKGAREGAGRLARFQRRVAWGDATPLGELFSLGQDGFQGRDYDEVASFMGWLMDADGGARRAGTLALLARVMDGRGETGDFARYVGLSPEEAERRWKASLSR